MNFCLRFRSKDHSAAYMSSFSLLIRRKCSMGIILNLGMLSYTIIKLTLDAAPEMAATLAINIVQIIVSLLWIAGIFCLKKKIGRIFKYQDLILFILDIMLLFVAVDFKPIIPLDESATVELALSDWHEGVIFICYLSVITIWQIRVLACSIQAGIMISILVNFNSTPRASVMIVFGFLTYAITTYLNEKFERIEFLERAKLYADSEAIKKILENITEGILIVERKNIVLYSNRTMRTMFNRSNVASIEEIFGQVQMKALFRPSGCNSQSMISFSDQPQDNRTLIEAFEEISECLYQETKGVATTAGDLSRFQGSCITIEATTNINDGQSSHIRNYLFKFTASKYNDKQVIVVQVSDTTDRDELLSLQDNSNYKNRLLASVSHELRTPLNGSINFIEQALGHADMPADLRERLILPSLRCNRMLLFIINDILDFSQIQANKLQLKFETKSIIDDAKECIELLEMQAIKRGIDLRLDSLLVEGKEQLCTDHNRLKQIILNLLSNAVKFTFSGEVVLKLQEIYHEGARSIKISCIDTGIGLSPVNQKKLIQAFEKFEIGDKIAINSTGAGLGLVISNNIAQKLNKGSENQKNDARAIKFESQVNKGSHFWFEVLDQQRQTIDLSSVHPNMNDHLSLSDHSLSGIFSDDQIQEIYEPEFEYKSRFQHLSCQDITIKGSVRGSLLGLLAPDQDYSLIGKNKCMCPPVLIVDDDSFNPLTTGWPL